jgi:hypothetical protein
MVGGSLSADGTIVTARSAGAVLADVSVVQGRYVLLVPQPPTGSGIHFAIGGLAADQSSNWQPGGATVLDLTTQMSNQVLDSDLDPLEGNLVRLFHRDPRTSAWTFYDPQINPLDRSSVRLMPGSVYWIKVSHDQRVSHHGRDTSLMAGWNLVAW